MSGRPLPLPADIAGAVDMLTTTYTRDKFDRLDGRLTAVGFDWCTFPLPDYHACLNHYNNAIR